MSVFNEKAALVTGAGSGIGQAVARLYAKNGARVMVSDVDDAGGKQTVAQIRQAGGEASYLHADVSKPEACEALVQETVKQYGQLDMACNNAGIGGAASLTGDYPVEAWQQVIDINLNGVFYCMRYEIPAMQARGGAIVNMASILGRVGFATAPAYVAAKHGILGLTKTAALEYARQGIRINSVGPGFIHTPLIAGLEADQDTNNLLVSLHPMGRLGDSDEVAELVIWLSSDKASFVTGSYYPVDGGYLAQ